MKHQPPSSRPRRGGGKKSASTKAPGQRQLRVGERIRHILTDILRRGDLHDPELSNASLITITAVNIGPDLQHAFAYFMPLGGKDAETIEKALNRAAGFFRSAIGKELDLRYAPKISFKIDHSFDRVAHIESLLHQDVVRRDIEKRDDDANDDDFNDDDDDNA